LLGREEILAIARQRAITLTDLPLLPEEQPQLPADWQQRYQAAAAACLPGDGLPPAPRASLILRLTVTDTGQIAQVNPFQSTANAAYDEALMCVVRGAGPLVPAGVAAPKTDVFLAIQPQPLGTP
jgi:hypothetical protein